jgi:hypothetical protein
MNQIYNLDIESLQEIWPSMIFYVVKNIIEGAPINTFCDVFIKECHKFMMFLLKAS